MLYYDLKPDGLQYSDYGSKLKINGCVMYDHYDFNGMELHSLTKVIRNFEVQAFETTHVLEIESYGFDIYINGNAIYYSGDTNSVQLLHLKNLRSNAYHAFYVDTCKADYDGNVHLSLQKLTELIEPEYRNKVWCMHLDEGFIREEAKELGFNVVVKEFH